MRLAIYVATFLILCVAGADADASSEMEALRARADGYWQARVQGLPITEYLVPREQGGPNPDRIERRRKKMSLDAATIDSVEVTDDSGVVEVKLKVARYHFKMSPQMAAALRGNELMRSKTVRQEWVRLDGIWYRGERLMFDGFFEALHQQQANRPAPVAGAEMGSGGAVTGGDPPVRSREN